MCNQVFSVERERGKKKRRQWTQSSATAPSQERWQAGPPRLPRSRHGITMRARSPRLHSGSGWQTRTTYPHRLDMKIQAVSVTQSRRSVPHYTQVWLPFHPVKRAWSDRAPPLHGQRANPRQAQPLRWQTLLGLTEVSCADWSGLDIGTQPACGAPDLEEREREAMNTEPPQPPQPPSLPACVETASSEDEQTLFMRAAEWPLPLEERSCLISGGWG